MKEVVINWPSDSPVKENTAWIPYHAIKTLPVSDYDAAAIAGRLKEAQVRDVTCLYKPRPYEWCLHVRLTQSVEFYTDPDKWSELLSLANHLKDDAIGIAFVKVLD